MATTRFSRVLGNVPILTVTVILVCAFIVFPSTLSSPAPSPDFKTAVMDGIRKLPNLIKGVIPMPENVALTINVDNRDAAAVAASQPSQERRSFYPSAEDGPQEFLHVNNGSSTPHEIPDHHILAMVLISIGVFLAGTIFVLTLWCCFRRRKKIITTIIGHPGSESDATNGSGRAYNYNNPKAEELLPKMPNVQKLIANFNKK